MIISSYQTLSLVEFMPTSHGETRQSLKFLFGPKNVGFCDYTPLWGGAVPASKATSGQVQTVLFYYDRIYRYNDGAKPGKQKLLVDNVAQFPRRSPSNLADHGISIVLLIYC